MLQHSILILLFLGCFNDQNVIRTFGKLHFLPYKIRNKHNFLLRHRCIPASVIKLAIGAEAIYLKKSYCRNFCAYESVFCGILHIQKHLGRFVVWVLRSLETPVQNKGWIIKQQSLV